MIQHVRRLYSKSLNRLPVLAILAVAAFSVSAGTAHAERFFERHSTWYQKVPNNPRITSGSSNYVHDVVSNKSTLGIGYRKWSVSYWYAKANTPHVRVPLSDDKPYAEALGWNVVPIPPEAVPPGNDLALEGRAWDGRMTVISHDRRYAWDFYRAKKDSNGRWSARNVRRWDLNGDGINSPYDGRGGIRACPVPLTHGMIMHDEIQKGYIDHALLFSYWGERKFDKGVYPCQKQNRGVKDAPWALSIGMRLQLDPSIDVDSLSLNRAGKIIAKALQEYGMIFVDSCGRGCSHVSAETLEEKPESWKNILSGLRAIPVNRFRVIDPLYSSSASISSSTTASTPSAPSNLKISK